MSDFRQEIKVPTEEEKLSMYEEILLKTLYLGEIGNSDVIKNRIQKQKKYSLSEDEITAISALASEVSMYVVSGVFYFNDIIPQRKMLMDGLIKNHGIDRDYLSKIMKATMHDINQTRQSIYKNRKWEFHLKRIFDVLDGKNPYKEYEGIEKRVPELKIVKFGQKGE